MGIGRTSLSGCLRQYCAFRSRNYISFLLSLNTRDVLTSPCIYYISALSYEEELVNSLTTHLRCAFAFPQENYSIMNISSLSEIHPQSKLHVNTQKEFSEKLKHNTALLLFKKSLKFEFSLQKSYV